MTTPLEKYEAVIGLEVHAQLATASKLFCPCSTVFGKPPNTNICPVCTGQPGTLPVLNRRAVEMAIKAGLAFHCTIREKSVFARKNYFYPDLPKGYQISQYEFPLCVAGHLDIPVENGGMKKIEILRIHMEEDAGKLVHDAGHPDKSHADLNRCGVPLIEIVSGPDLRAPSEAAAYYQTLRNILVYLDVCAGNMQEGNLRCDANISVRVRGSKKLGTRTEIKNVNSFKFVENALKYEIGRQIELLERGGSVAQETLGWNPQKGKTEVMRSKEEAHDYRYFPDPDLLPLVVDAAWVEGVRGRLPELPREMAERFVRQFEIPQYNADVLTQEKPVALYFEEAVRRFNAPKKISNWILSELLRELRERDCDIRDIRVPPRNLADLIALIEKGTISGAIAKEVFAAMMETGAEAGAIVAEKGMTQISDAGAIEKIVDDILAREPENVARYKSGKTNVLGFFVGQVMKASQGKANPKLINEVLKKKLT